MRAVHRARPHRRQPRTAAPVRPLHVALRPLLHRRRGPRPRGRRRAARNLTRRRLVGRRLGGSTDRSRLAATRRPDTRPALAGAMPCAASRQSGRYGLRQPQPDEKYGDGTSLAYVIVDVFTDTPGQSIVRRGHLREETSSWTTKCCSTGSQPSLQLTWPTPVYAPESQCVALLRSCVLWCLAAAWPGVSVLPGMLAASMPSWRHSNWQHRATCW